MEARWAVGKTKESWEESWKGNETEAAAKGGAGGAAKQAVPESPSKTETKASSAEQAGAAGSAGAGAGAAGRRKEDGGKGSETARCSCDKEAAVHCRVSCPHCLQHPAGCLVLTLACGVPRTAM
eukprot:199978-Rhodomonas_salina.3